MPHKQEISTIPVKESVFHVLQPYIFVDKQIGSLTVYVNMSTTNEGIIS